MDPTLYKAIASGDEERLESFSTQPIEKQKTSQKNSVLHIAVVHNQRAIVKKMLHSHPSLIECKNLDGDTPLHLAARLGLNEIAGDLIESVKWKSYLKRRHLSARLWLNMNAGDLIEFVKGKFYLKQLTRTLNIVDKDLALHDAVRNGHLSLVELLIKNDTELATLTNRAGDSPLFLALERKFFIIAKHLLDNTDKCSTSGKLGMNVLHLAVVYLHTGLPGEDIELANNEYHEILDIVNRVMIKCPSTLSEQDNLGWTPLHYAVHYGIQEAVESFLKKDKSLAYKRDKEGMSPFHIAAKKEENEIIGKIMNDCPDICELLTFNSQTALHVAVNSRKEKTVQYLLTTRVSNSLLNKQDKDGNTPLHLAALIEDFEILDVLLCIVPRMLLNRETVDLNLMNKDGSTLMDIIQSCNNLEQSRKSLIISKLRRVGGDLTGLKRQLIERQTELRKFEKVGERQLQLENKESDHHKAEDYKKKLNSVMKLFLQYFINPRSVMKLFLQPFINPHVANRAAEVDILIATLIATITFSVAYQVPGGYESSSDEASIMGVPILRNKKLFDVFVIFDALAFGLSSSSVFLHFLGSMTMNENNVVVLRVANATTFYSILAMLGTFLSALLLVSGHSKGINTAVYVCAFAFLSGPLVLKYLNYQLRKEDSLP